MVFERPPVMGNFFWGVIRYGCKIRMLDVNLEC